MPDASIERIVEVGPKASVAVENRSGRTSVCGWGESRVKVVAAVRRSGVVRDLQSYLEEVADGVRKVGNEVYVEAPPLGGRSGVLTLFTARPRVDYEIWMPRGGSLRVESRSGDIKVLEVDGEVELSSRSGSVETAKVGSLLRARSRSGSVRIAGVEGSAAARSASGSIRVADVGAHVEAAARSGSVEVRAVGGDVHASSASGSLRLVDGKGQARLNTVSGSIDVAEVGGPLRASTISGHLEAERCGGAMDLSSISGSVVYRGAIRGDASIKTVSGSVRLVVPPSSTFVIDAESRSGSIHSDLPVCTKDLSVARSGSPPRTVRIRTVSGSVRLSADVGQA